MYYIVFDLEWNQAGQKRYEVPEIPFEIIEIGGVKINDDGEMIGEFDELIKPQVYHEMHDITSKLIHIQMRELQRGKKFQEIASRFVEWSNEEDAIFCTWGAGDLYELQNNMAYYKMEPLSEGPIEYLDVQKLFALAFGEKKQRRSLEYAVDFLNIEKDIPFHRAFSDAYYTAKVLLYLEANYPEVFSYRSYDVYHPPVDRQAEIKTEFGTYVKYISRVFPDRQTAFQDAEVAALKCYLCHKNVRKKIKWFSPNSKSYVCLGTCPVHGMVKGKIRIHKKDDGIFVVKTMKLVNKEEADDILAKRNHLRELRKRKNRNEKKTEE